MTILKMIFLAMPSLVASVSFAEQPVSHSQHVSQHDLMLNRYYPQGKELVANTNATVLPVPSTQHANQPALVVKHQPLKEVVASTTSDSPLTVQPTTNKKYSELKPKHQHLKDKGRILHKRKFKLAPDPDGRQNYFVEHGHRMWFGLSNSREHRNFRRLKLTLALGFVGTHHKYIGTSYAADGSARHHYKREYHSRLGDLSDVALMNPGPIWF